MRQQQFSACGISLDCYSNRRGKKQRVKNLAATATDPENDTLTYTWTATAGTVTGTGTTAIWTAPATGTGTATIRVVAKDPAGLEGFTEVAISYAPGNAAPVVSDLSATPAGNAKCGDVKSLAATATDPENDTLTYTWTAAGTVTGTETTIAGQLQQQEQDLQLLK